MTKEEMKARTKQFALRVIRLVNALPRGRAGDVIGYQLLKAGTSVGANYRAACRARSGADFVSKLGIVEEEADESQFWLEVIVESDMMPLSRVAPLIKEADEIIAIVVRTITTTRSRGGARRRSEIRNPKSEIPNPQSEIE